MFLGPAWPFKLFLTRSMPFVAFTTFYTAWRPFGVLMIQVALLHGQRTRTLLACHGP